MSEQQKKFESNGNIHYIQFLFAKRQFFVITQKQGFVYRNGFPLYDWQLRAKALVKKQ